MKIYKKMGKLFLTLLFINMCVFTVYAQKQTVSITLKNATLKELLQTIEKQTSYKFSYRNVSIDDVANINMNKKNATVESVLNSVLQSKSLNFEVVSERSIVIFAKPKPQVNAQPKISGVIIDEKGEPIIGANILVEGTTTGTISDLDGKFSIRSNPNELLFITYVGYKSQKFPVRNKNNITIILEEDTKLLNEVVVVGYGTQKKLNMTGAVASISGDQLSSKPLSNAAQGLQGLIPNLNVTFNSGQPDTKASFNIRGNTSLNGGSALILVDGAEITDLNLINPQDIESVSVLKDASSAAIYGARAAFGVVLVTTKSGNKNQKIRVNYNNNFSWNTPSRLPELPNSSDWCRFFNRQMDYGSPGTFYFNDRFMAAVDAHNADPINNPAILVDTEGIQSDLYTPTNPGWAYVGNTDWIHEFYKNAAFMQQHNLSLSGGTEKNSYYASLGYRDQSGIFRYGNDSYSRINASFKFDTELTKWLKLGVMAKYNNTNTDEPYRDDSGSWFYEVYRMYPTLSVFLPNGDFAGMFLSKGNNNVIGEMATAGRKTKSTNDMWYSANFELNPLKGLTIKGDYSLNQYVLTQKQNRKTTTQTMPEGVDPILVKNPSSLRNYTGKNVYQIFNIWAEYKKSFTSGHNMTIMAGYNQESKNITGHESYVTNLFDNNLPAAGLAKDIQSVDETSTSWAVQGAFFRVNYDYKSRYLIEVNGRYDGSSKYASNDRWAFFPSGSIGWRISEEKFMESAAHFLNNLKIRASIGMLGNQVTDNNFQYLATLSDIPAEDLGYMMNGKLLSALKGATLPNLVTWEKVISKNIGLDWSFLNSRLSGAFDFYVRDTKDMVRSKTYPAVLGASTGKENIADMRTTGWEFEIGWRDRIPSVIGSPLAYDITVGLSDYQAEITKYNNPLKSFSDNYYKGQKLGEIWGYVTDGLIVDEAEGQRMNYIQRKLGVDWHPGMVRYKDLNGDGFINDGSLTVDDPGDKKVIGNTTPRYRFNINAGLSWHNFDINVLFDGVCKRDLWTNSDQYWGAHRGIYNSNLTQYHIDNTWSYTNPNAYFPRSINSTNYNYYPQTQYIQNAAFIRLKSVTLGYTLPRKWLKTLRLDQIRIYASGMNLWEKTGLLPFMTPDIADNVASAAESNLMGQNGGKEYAFMRSYSFGLSITF